MLNDVIGKLLGRQRDARSRSSSRTDALLAGVIVALTVLAFVLSLV
jgi:hypothetical protein